MGRCYLCVGVQYFLELGVHSVRENVTDHVMLANNDLAVAVDLELPRPAPIVLNKSDKVLDMCQTSVVANRITLPAPIWLTLRLSEGGRLAAPSN